MQQFLKFSFLNFILLISINSNSQISTDTIVWRDLPWDSTSPAGMIELTIPSNGSLLAGIIYTANGKQKHPTLILLHGIPGNERNLDIAQIVRAQGWNVIFFDHRIWITLFYVEWILLFVLVTMGGWFGWLLGCLE